MTRVSEDPRTRARRLRHRRMMESVTALLLCALAMAMILLGLAAVSTAARGAEPTCSFPPIAESFQTLSNKAIWTSAMQNRVNCAVNRLQQRSLVTGAPQTVCAPVTVSAGTRQLVTLPLGTAVAGTEPVFVSAVDPTNPARLQADGIQGISGTIASVFVFNHDAVNARTGRVCVTVVRS